MFFCFAKSSYWRPENMALLAVMGVEGVFATRLGSGVCAIDRSSRTSNSWLDRGNGMVLLGSRWLIGIKFSGGSRNGWRLLFCGGGGFAAVRVMLRSMLSIVFVRWCGLGRSSDARDFGSTGFSPLHLGGLGASAGCPSASAVVASHSFCADLVVPEKKGGWSASRGLSYAFGIAGTGGTVSSSSPY